MITRRVRVQLLVFAVVTALVVWYGATRLLGLGSVLNPPYTVEMQVDNAGGLYPRADVDVLGTRVGSVAELRAGPGRRTTVVLDLDAGTEVPRDVRAVVGSKSAIGEGYVLLEPRSADGPVLVDGDVIGVEDTVSPPRLEQLLSNLDDLVASVPRDDLATVLDEAALALDDLGGPTDRLLAGTQVLTRDTLANLDDLTALIRDANTVLSTQAELGPGTRRWTRALASLTKRLRELDPTVVSIYDTGLRASTGVTNLLADNQQLLPVLLSNLVSLTTVAQERTPELRKTLVIFPWILQNSINTTRHCDEYDIRTGKAVESTCHYDENGDPIYTLHLSQQAPQVGTFQPCTQGYEGTQRYQPDGRPVAGDGPLQSEDAEPNLRAGCTASPTDPRTPNVRGAQNVTTPAWRKPEPAVAGDTRARSGGRASGGSAAGAGRDGTTAIWNPSTGVLTTGRSAVRLTGMHGDPPPSGPDGLAWLLTSPLGGER